MAGDMLPTVKPQKVKREPSADSTVGPPKVKAEPGCEASAKKNRSGKPGKSNWTAFNEKRKRVKEKEEEVTVPAVRIRLCGKQSVNMRKRVIQICKRIDSTPVLVSQGTQTD